MKTRLVSITKALLPELSDLSPEELIVYCARVSNPNNQLNTDTAPKLLSYLIQKKHWSPFEMVDVCFEIITSRGISAQILRHWSFSFQEFSQRYAEVSCEYEPLECRVKGTSNRQSSVLSEDPALQAWWKEKTDLVQNTSSQAYEEACKKGIAPEVARMLLPLGVQTRLYMKASVRDWIHYFDLRCAESTQKEHRDVALSIRAEMSLYFPNIALALNW